MAEGVRLNVCGGSEQEVRQDDGAVDIGPDGFAALRLAVSGVLENVDKPEHDQEVLKEVTHFGIIFDF
jgi:hypothetical protein